MSLSSVEDEPIDFDSPDEEMSSDNDEPSASKSVLNKSFQESADPPLYVIPPQQSLYQSAITRSEHLLAASALATRFHLSSKAIAAVLEFVQIHIPDVNIGETSVEKLKEECGFGADYLKYHLYCEECKKLFSFSDDCETPGCQGSKMNPEYRKYFVTSELEVQLKEIFERPGVWDSIQESRVWKESGNISDIRYGSGYLKLLEPGGFLHDTTNITLSLFTDGIPLFKSSSVSLWPVYLIINELPARERFKRKNLILWGIWQGTGKPKMCMFLKPLVLDLITLYQHGATFRYNGESICCKGMLIIATMDLQARAYFLNMTQHNGEHGCLYCMEPGVILPSGMGVCRSYGYNEELVLTTELDARRCATDARMSGRRTYEFFGENVFMYLPYFNMTTNVTIDYMHGILLGVCKKLMDLWINSNYATEPFYIGEKSKIMDKLMKSIKPPYFIHRKPRIITKNYSHWKASEWRNWLLFYSLPCLIEHLPKVYLVHFSCLVEVVYILLGEGISSTDLSRADLLLKSFCSNVSKLYSSNVMGLNFHNLSHLITFVKLWGPLWCWSCFAFESFNGQITKAIHGTGNVCREVFWFLQAQKRVERKVQDKSDGHSSTKAYAFMQSMVSSKTSDDIHSNVNAFKCSVINVQDVQEDFDNDIKEKLLALTGTDKSTDFSSVSKVARNGFTMYSAACPKVKKQNSFTLLMEKKIGAADVVEVKKFLLHKQTKKVFAVGRLIARAGPILANRVPHLQQLSYISDSLDVVSADNLREPLVIIGKGAVMYGAALPNQYERD